MNTFPARGMNTIYDLSSVIPDSASTATAIATGNKSKSGVIAMDADQKMSYETIAEKAKKRLESGHCFHCFSGSCHTCSLLRACAEPQTDVRHQYAVGKFRV
jgi:hypothetical protein